MVKGR